MPKFRKKPVEIEAIRVLDLITGQTAGNLSSAPPWALEALHEGVLEIYAMTVEIRTLEGNMEGGVNDWIIRGIAGELYPCKPDIFAATYEPVG